MKRAIILAAFGSAAPQAMENDLLPIARSVAAAHPDCSVHLALTSRIILQRLWEKGLDMEGLEESIAHLRSEGFRQIAILPALAIPGTEYQKILALADGCHVAAPLLNTDADLDWMAGLIRSIAAEEEYPLLLMGHGSGSEADQIYAALRRRLPENVFLACREGECTLIDLLPHLEKRSPKEITLMPLMLTAGNHALHDLAGDDSDSWKSILESHGFTVRLRLQGLGSLRTVQQRFAEKALF